MRAALATLALAALALPAAASIAEVPENDGWVTDLAGLLTESQERSLESLAASYESGTGHEIAVLTVPSLGGEPIERLALEVGREWKIGKRGLNDGALIVVAKAERKMRIEVGRGLEGGLTDSIAGRIIRDVMRPEFKEGRFYEGIRGGLEATHAAIGGDYGPIERGQERKARKATFATLIMLLAFGFFAIAAARNRRRHGSRGGMLYPMMYGTSGRGVGGGGFSGGGFGGFGGGGGFSGGGASGGW